MPNIISIVPSGKDKSIITLSSGEQLVEQNSFIEKTKAKVGEDYDQVKTRSVSTKKDNSKLIELAEKSLTENKKSSYLKFLESAKIEDVANNSERKKLVEKWLSENR